MGYINKKHYSKGIKAEIAFLSLCDDSEPATLEQDAFEHYDHLVTLGTQEFEVDIKAMFGNKNYNPNEHTRLELKNRNGGNGWLIADKGFIAFERPNDFFLVSRRELKEYYKDKVMPHAQTAQKGQDYYHYYPRTRSEHEKSKSLIAVVPFNDFVNLPHIILFKMYPKRSIVKIRGKDKIYKVNVQSMLE